MKHPKFLSFVYSIHKNCTRLV